MADSKTTKSAKPKLPSPKVGKPKLPTPKSATVAAVAAKPDVKPTVKVEAKQTARPKTSRSGTVPRHLLHEVVKWQLAKKRQGTAKTKQRNEVAGSTRKIYRQKGTGRARHGSSKAP